MAIDETSLSNGEFYTFVTNKDKQGLEGSVVAIVAGTKSDDVLRVLKQIDKKNREAVKEVTLDLSDSMERIVSSVFPKANRVIETCRLRLAIESLHKQL